MFTVIENFTPLIQGFLANETLSPETTTAAISSDLELEAVKITNEWNILWNNPANDYPIPTRPVDPDDLTAVDILLEDFNLMPVLTDFIYNKVARQYETFAKQSIYLKLISDQKRAMFTDKRLRAIFERRLTDTPVSKDYFFNADINDEDNEIQLLARDIPGFIITANTEPNIITSLQIAQRECVFIRAIAAQRQYNDNFNLDGETPDNELTDAQKKTYLELMLAMVCPQIARIALSYQYTNDIDMMINTKLFNAWKNLMDLFAGKAVYRQLFRGQ